MEENPPDTADGARALVGHSGGVLGLCLAVSTVIQVGYVQVALDRTAHVPEGYADTSEDRMVEISQRYEYVFYPEGRLPWDVYQPPPERPRPRLRFHGIGHVPLTPLGDSQSGSMLDALGQTFEPWQVTLEKVTQTGLADQSAEHVADKRTRRLAGCFGEEETLAEADAGHRLIVRLSIDPSDGRVEGVEFSDASFDMSDRLESCLRTRLERWPFQPVEGRSEVTVTYDFGIAKVLPGFGGLP